MDPDELRNMADHTGVYICEVCRIADSVVSCTYIHLAQHEKSADHKKAVFEVSNWAQYSPVTPQELDYLKYRNLYSGTVLLGPMIQTSHGFTRAKAKYRQNPWVDRVEVLTNLLGFDAQVESLNTPKRRKFIPLEQYKLLARIRDRFQAELKQIIMEASGR